MARALPPAYAGTIRIALSLIFCLLLFQSWRIAAGDMLANSPAPGSLDRAIALEPDDEKYRMWKASADLFAEGVPASRMESELNEVMKRNPRNAEAIMDLGLIAESQGDGAKAERLLQRATQVDHTFKPAWTLINFYFRNSQLDKMWPEVRRALELTTRPEMAANVQTVYDLLWQTGADPKLLGSLIPSYPDASLGYFSYLVWHNHTDAAREVYPRALPFTKASSPFHRAILGDYCNLLFLARQVDEAVEVWNTLVQKRFLVSTELHPEQGNSLANADFEFPLERSPFGWTTADIPSTYAPHSLQFDFSGNQPEVAAVLLKNLAVVPDRDYVLKWDASGSGITRPSDLKELGLNISFYDGDKRIPAVCSGLLAPEKERGCAFHVPPGLQALHMKLLAERLPGTVRIQGTLQLSGFHLAFRPMMPPS